MELTTEIRELSPDELRKRQQISQAARILRGSVGARFDASPASSEDGLSIPKGNGRGKVRLLSRRAIDGRRREAKVFDAIATGIAKELGGSERLSTVQRHLIEAFAGCVVVLQAINVRLLLGGEVDVAEQAMAANVLVRLASRIGVERKPIDITPSLAQLQAEAEALAGDEAQ